MSFFESIILGIVQGVGEFLPISSSAHLILIPFLFDFNLNLDSATHLTYDIALHFGTLLAVVFVFYKDWLKLFNGAYEKVVHKKNSFESNMFFYIVIATIPGALAGLLLGDYIESTFRSMILVIALLLGIMGLLIYLGDHLAEKKYSKPTSYEKINFKQAVIIGFSQALAIFPGFSRSGTTILAARTLGLSREAAAKFSFLLSVPIIFGATIIKIPDLMNNFNNQIFIGIFTSALVGFLSIKFLLAYIKKYGFAIFAYYRILIAIIVIAKLVLN